jgi:hypothetical protein
MSSSGGAGSEPTPGSAPPAAAAATAIDAQRVAPRAPSRSAAARIVSRPRGLRACRSTQVVSKSSAYSCDGGGGGEDDGAAPMVACSRRLALGERVRAGGGAS